MTTLPFCRKPYYARRRKSGFASALTLISCMAGGITADALPDEAGAKRDYAVRASFTWILACVMGLLWRLRSAQGCRVRSVSRVMSPAELWADDSAAEASSRLVLGLSVSLTCRCWF